MRPYLTPVARPNDLDIDEIFITRCAIDKARGLHPTIGVAGIKSILSEATELSRSAAADVLGRTEARCTDRYFLQRDLLAVLVLGERPCEKNPGQTFRAVLTYLVLDRDRRAAA